MNLLDDNRTSKVKEDVLRETLCIILFYFILFKNKLKDIRVMRE